MNSADYSCICSQVLYGPGGGIAGDDAGDECGQSGEVRFIFAKKLANFTIHIVLTSASNSGKSLLWNLVLTIIANFVWFHCFGVYEGKLLCAKRNRRNKV